MGDPPDSPTVAIAAVACFWEGKEDQEIERGHLTKHTLGGDINSTSVPTLHVNVCEKGPRSNANFN